MRKIKTCICDSTKKIDNEPGNPIFPICLTDFLINMASILLIDAEQRLMIDVPTVGIGKDEFDGKAKMHPSTLDVLSVWNGNDLMRNMSEHFQLHGFLNWFMEQKEPDDEEDLTMWYDMDFLLDKWNEYVAQHNE